MQHSMPQRHALLQIFSPRSDPLNAAIGERGAGQPWRKRDESSEDMAHRRSQKCAGEEARDNDSNGAKSNVKGRRLVSLAVSGSPTDGVPSAFSAMCKIEEMRSTRDDLTIDASGPSPEENDECLSQHTQDLQRLTVMWLQQGPTSTSGEVASEISKKIKSIELRLGELGKQQQECLETLSAHGWFLSPDTPVEQLQIFTDSLGENDGSGKKDAISSHFRKRIDSIESELSKSYPLRRQILHDAFEAHRAGKYTLSVPVFLSQADGIWRDQFRENFFQKQKLKSTLQDCKNDPQLQHVATMLTLLEPKEPGKNNPLWASESERGNLFDALNRHQVLHGESVDYATEQNSFKAISLLTCFQGVCRRVAQ